MEARAHLRYARISPRKVSIVLDLIRNKPSRLDEMLRVANCNIALADQMAHERGAVLSFTTAPSYIP